MMRKIAAGATAVLALAACPADGSEPATSPTALSTSGVSETGRCGELPLLVRRVRRGHVPGSSPDIDLIPREPNYIGAAASPVHSGPWDYLAHVPLILHGQRVRPGRYVTDVTMADVAPTTAKIIGHRSFDPSSGKPQRTALDLSQPVPRLVVTIVWDGGGDNVLREHPDAHPYLDRLIAKSASFTNMEIGSSPSVTPPIHATLSTGEFPRVHGIPGLRIRTPEGEYVDPFFGLDPSAIRVDTLADHYDEARRNRATIAMLATVNWHLGMIGQGARQPGGDRDVAILFDEEGITYTNPELYAAPVVGDPRDLVAAAGRLDGQDGKRDGSWMSHDVSDPQVRYASPAHVVYQAMLLEELIVEQALGRDPVPDLLYVNFKSLDDAGHNWGMTSDEIAVTLEATDEALHDLVGTLNRAVGRDRWTLILTADHGQTPYPRESGAWPIGGGELARDVNSALDRDGDNTPLVDRVSSPGAYLNHSELRDNPLSMRDVARWIARYTVAQNLREDAVLPRRFEGRERELVFDAALVGGERVVSEAC